MDERDYKAMNSGLQKGNSKMKEQFQELVYELLNILEVSILFSWCFTLFKLFSTMIFNNVFNWELVILLWSLYFAKIITRTVHILLDPKNLRKNKGSLNQKIYPKL